MRVSRLSLHDFRSYTSVEVDLRPGATVFLGPNGEGKTNLLEAVNFLATLGSYRAGQDAALVRAEAQAAVVRAAVQRSTRRILIELEIRPGSGLRGRLNRSPVNRARDLLGALRAVVTVDRWWRAGLEMLLLGIAVALAAYGSGAFVAWLLGSV